MTHSEDRKPDLLTREELRALYLCACGHTDEGAGRRCGISARTHRRRLNTAEVKLGAKTRPHAIALAITLGYIRVGEPQ